MTNIEDQDKVRNYINEAFEMRRKDRPQYSLRAFASKIEVSPGNLSQFFNRKKVFNKKTLDKILTILEPNPETRKEFLYDYNNQLISKIKQQSTITNYPSLKIEATSFDKIKDPIYFNFLNLIETEGFNNGQKQEIINKLQISCEFYDSMINTLINENIISVSNDGKISRNALHLKTDDDISMAALREHHQKIIEKSVIALKEVPIELRDITSMTLPVNIEQLPKAKEIIRKFQDDMLHLLNQNPRTEVYHLSVALFPANKLNN